MQCGCQNTQRDKKKKKAHGKNKQTKTQTGTNNTANPVIFIQRCIQKTVWYFWCKPLKTLMSKMLAHVGWMDFHTRQILPERFHTETLFCDSHIPKERRHTHTHTYTCACAYAHRNKHRFREHFVRWKLHTRGHGAAALYSVAAYGLDITHFWKQKPDNPLCLLLA